LLPLFVLVVIGASTIFTRVVGLGRSFLIDIPNVFHLGWVDSSGLVIWCPQTSNYRVRMLHAVSVVVGYRIVGLLNLLALGDVI